MKKNPTKLKLMDFDSTLVFTPGPDTSIEGLPARQFYENWIATTNSKKKPFTGWWGRTETISPPIFGCWCDEGYVPPEDLLNTKLFQIVQDNRDDPECLSIMATGRHVKMRDPRNDKQHMVKTILDAYGLEFDFYHYCVGGQPTLQFKCGLIETYLQDYNQIRNIEIWEDREQHYSKFWEMVKWLKKQGRIDEGFVHLVQPPERFEGQ